MLIKIKDIVSKDFVKLFVNNESLTIDKVSQICEFYAKCCFNNIKDEINKYQVELTIEDNLDKYFKKDNPITKKDFIDAIRLFISLVLLPEEDKENKIKHNHYNIINYLNFPDFWNKNIYNHKNFKKNLDELKKVNVQISQIISLYDFLEKDKNVEDEFFVRVEKKVIDDNFVQIQNNDEEDEGPIKRIEVEEDEDDE